jgi:hypothetical protein
MGPTERDGKHGHGPVSVSVSSRGGKLFRYLGFGLLLSAFFCMSLIQEEETALATSNSNSNSKVTLKNITVEETFTIPDLSRLENCTISFVKPTTNLLNTSAKPLLFPSANGFNDKTVISLLTGGLASRSWHNSRKGLRHCITAVAGETATCMNSHPGVDIGPERQTGSYDSRVLLGIRNQLTNFPASNNEKAIKYHGVKGQVAENGWRGTRDKWFNQSVTGWMNTIRTWRNMSYYTIGTYVPYEHWLDPDRGPALFQQIADVLREAGFSVAPPQDIPFIWYRSTKDKYVADQEFFKYVPGYTLEQRDYFLVELERFMEETAGDPVLLPILKEYYADVQDNTRIDIPKIVNLTQG